MGTTGGVASPGPWARARVFLQAPSARHARSQAEKLALTRGPRRLAVIGGRAAECRPSALRSSGSLFSCPWPGLGSWMRSRMAVGEYEPGSPETTMMANPYPINAVRSRGRVIALAGQCHPTPSMPDPPIIVPMPSPVPCMPAASRDPADLRSGRQSPPAPRPQPRLRPHWLPMRHHCSRKLLRSGAHRGRRLWQGDLSRIPINKSARRAVPPCTLFADNSRSRDERGGGCSSSGPRGEHPC